MTAAAMATMATVDAATSTCREHIPCRPRTNARVDIRWRPRALTTLLGNGHTGRDAYQDESSSRCHLARPSRRPFPSNDQRQFHALRLHRLRSDARGRMGASGAGGAAAEEGEGREGRGRGGRYGLRARRAPVGARFALPGSPGARAIASGGLSPGVRPGLASGLASLASDVQAMPAGPDVERRGGTESASGR
jgi:hypothetical protein